MIIGFKRVKKIAEVSLFEHSRNWEIYFALRTTTQVFLCE